MGEIYDKWSVCDWKVRCWEQETTQVLPFGGEDGGVFVWSKIKGFDHPKRGIFTP